MTVDELKNNEKFKRENPCFFKPNTLAFFGEKISEMQITGENLEVTDNMGNKHKCIVLKTIQHNAPIGVPATHLYYFDRETMQEVFC